MAGHHTLARGLKRGALGMAVCAAIGWGSGAQAAPPWKVFRPFNAFFANAGAINAHSDIVGSYMDSSFTWHGYLRAPGGTFTSIDEPDATGNTFATSIDFAGNIIGTYTKGSQVVGFLRSAAGSFTSIEIPGSTLTIPLGINNKGVIAGYSYAAGITASFVRAADGTLTPFSVSVSTNVQATAINGKGTVVGYYDINGVQSAFIRAANGTITTFDVLGATVTRPVGINSKGQIAGYYFLSDFVDHGFLRDADGTITTFDPPDTGQFGSDVHSIDFDGNIVGCFSDSSDSGHGFVRDAAGTFRQLDVPGASGTCPFMIGPNGKIVGYTEQGKAFRLTHEGWLSIK